MTRSALLLAALLAAPTRAHAQQPAQPPACTRAEHRLFDFWLGEWNVFNRQGQQVGTSRITSVSNGCALLEEWQAVRGANGRSINFFDAADNQWHQVWVGGDGTVLRIAGTFSDAAMRLAGEIRAPQGSAHNRITWTPQSDGAVEQRWDISTDGGATWQPSFVGMYRRK